MKIKLCIFFGLVLLTVLFAGLVLASASSKEKMRQKNHVIVQGELPLNDRYNNEYVNQIMKDNILLSLAYLQGSVKNPSQIDWNQVEKPFTFELKLKPSETFAFHDMLLDQYKATVVATGNSHFSSLEGFKSDGYLFGDGVCHLASIINMVARAAKLDVVSPVPHDFAKINDVPKQYGVSIYASPDSPESSKLQNLYITNNSNKQIAFVFTHTKDALDVAVKKLD